ncbi:hypothetical protein [Agromyces lapidis]|uniref:Uncharacterized protein n=1 Tax=Agromyces lapidis TaxID=279574 RepID=A0ABV5SMD3_9MICO|nr:hypothetical protein [Agromyces lapidis]
MNTVEHLTDALTAARKDSEYTRTIVANLEQARDHHRHHASMADAELVTAYHDRDATEQRVRELESQLIAAWGEPS